MGCRPWFRATKAHPLSRFPVDLNRARLSQRTTLTERTALTQPETTIENNQRGEYRMKQIIVPVDGSEAAGHAARFAYKLAQDTGARLTLLHVYNAPAAVMLGFGALTQEQVLASQQLVSRGSFDHARSTMEGETNWVETDTVIGHPGTEIAAYAKQKKADLIIMGSRGMSAVAELLMGSVSEYVVRHASCPVTIVR